MVLIKFALDFTPLSQLKTVKNHLIADIKAKTSK